jgi:PAS domain S-box-containing protein
LRKRDPLEETEHVLAERVREALWQSQVQHMRSQEWFNFASDGYLLTDMEGVIYETNYAAAALLDVRKEFLLGKPLGLFMGGDCRRRFYEHLARMSECDGVQCWEGRVYRPGGQPREVALTAAAVSGEQGHGIKIRWMIHDVSKARQVERAWQAEKALADCLVETAEILILLVDEYGTIHRCNPFVLAVSSYGASELHGENWIHRLLTTKEQEAGLRLLNEAHINGSSRSSVLDLVPGCGECRRVLWSARKLGEMLLLIGHDVTELQEAERQALQAERLAAIGQMVAGLAHESRNALQRGQACLALLALRLQDQPECLELLGRIEKAQDDLQHLFNDVRAYAVAPPLQRRWSDLRSCWREAWGDLAPLPEWATAVLEEKLDTPDLLCQVDPFYLKHVFRNLLENALAAGGNPVRVVVRCEPADLGEEEAICIRVRDNGPGIPVESRARLFEPFFTTKVRGTGLGLAICRRIIEAHGGHIHVGDTSGSGAEIVLTLPRRET